MIYQLPEIIYGLLQLSITEALIGDGVNIQSGEDEESI